MDPQRVQQHSFLEIDHEIFSVVILSLPTGTVAQLVKHPLCDWEVGGSIPGRVIPVIKENMVLVALSLGTQKVELGIRTGQLSFSVM